MIGYLFQFRWGAWLFQFFNPAEPFFAGLFIFICGISCRLSHNNWKRGALLALVAAGMSLFLYLFMREQMIWFGVLHFLAVSILLFALLRPALDRIPPLAGVIASFLLLAMTWWVPALQGQPAGDRRTVHAGNSRMDGEDAPSLSAGIGRRGGGGLFSPPALVFLLFGRELHRRVG